MLCSLFPHIEFTRKGILERVPQEAHHSPAADKSRVSLGTRMTKDEIAEIAVFITVFRNIKKNLGKLMYQNKIMKNFLLKRFRIEHVYYGELIALSMCLLLVFLFALLLGLDYDSQVIEGSFLFIMILLILYAGGYIWRYGIVLMVSITI